MANKRNADVEHRTSWSTQIVLSAMALVFAVGFAAGSASARCTKPSNIPCLQENSGSAEVHFSSVASPDESASSMSLRAKVALTFVNTSPEPASVLWDPEDGQKAVVVLEGIPPGGQHIVHGFVGHRFLWRVTPDSADVHSVRAIKAGQIFVLTEEQYFAARGTALDRFDKEEEICVDRLQRDRCEAMRESGDCQTGIGWMALNCAATCELCELTEASVRCDLRRFNQTAAISQTTDSLDQLFNSIIAHASPKYSPTILSRPAEGPWVVTLDDFVTDDEVEAVLKHTRAHLARSTDQGATDARTGETAKVVSEGRTSSNAWCMNDCEADPSVAGLLSKVEALTGIAPTHYEQMQVLRYEQGEEYRRHHDQGDARAIPEPAGPRLLTLFMYFNDVDEGGETAFPDLDPPIRVTPRRGRVLLWPSVLSDDLMQRDPRTHHQALPVVEGSKFAANFWIHLFEFRKPNLWGCTGSFAEA